MRVEGLAFAGIAVFLAVVDVIYWLLSKDPTGTTCIALAGGLAGLIGYYCLFISRRIPPRPEDRGDANVADGAGEVGFFSPASYWPISAAGAFTVVGFGIAYKQIWLGVVGFSLLLLAVGGFLFEYVVGESES